MRNRAGVMVLVAALGACGTTANYEEILRSWVGDSEESLVASWGIPSASYSTGETKYLIYRNSRVFVDDFNNDIMLTTFSCETTFTVVMGIIDRWEWRGNSCRSR